MHQTGKTLIVLLQHAFLSSLLVRKLLSFHRSLSLEGLTPHLFLPSNTLFIITTTVFPHLLLPLKHLLLFLQVELNLVLSSSLGHLCLILNRFPSFMFDQLLLLLDILLGLQLL